MDTVKKLEMITYPYRKQCLDRQESAVKIQTWWRKNREKIRELNLQYVSQVEKNYCHALELLFYSINRYGKTLLIPIYLRELQKFTTLFNYMEKQGYTFYHNSGTGIVYHENFMNRYARQNYFVSLGHLFESKPRSEKDVIYVTREKSKKRKLMNEKDVILFLKRKIPEMKVVELDEKTTVLDQAKMFLNCKTLIGVHGAGISNLLWMNTGNVFEITPRGHCFHDFDVKSQKRFLDHRYIDVSEYKKSEESEKYPRDCYMTMSKTEMQKMWYCISEKMSFFPSKERIRHH